MSEKDGYDAYLKRSADAANAAGVTSNDPEVALRQRQSTAGLAGHPAPQSSGGVLAGIALLIVIFGPIFVYYRSFVETVSGPDCKGFGSFANDTPNLFLRADDTVQCTGLIVENLWLDGIIFFVLLAGLLVASARVFGYFLACGYALVLPLLGAEGDLVPIAFIVPIAFYLAFWSVGMRKFTAPVWVSLCLFFVSAPGAAFLYAAARGDSAPEISALGAAALCVAYFVLSLFSAAVLRLWRRRGVR